MTPNVFSFDDLISRTGSPEAAAALMLAELRKVPAERRKEVLFTAGQEYHFFAERAQAFRWHISNHEQGVARHSAILLEGLRNVTLRGNGASLLMHGGLVPLAIVNCQDVVVADLVIDYPTPTVQQLEILEADEGRDEMLCEVSGETPFRIEDSRLVFQAEDRELRPYWCMPFEQNRHLICQCADQRLYEPRQPALQLEGPRRVRFIHPNRLFRPGQRLVLRDAHRPAPACFFYLSNNIVFKDVAIHFSDGMGFLAQRCANLALERCACAPSPAQPWRYFSCLADATHFVGCRGTIRVESSRFEQMGDDAINVHGVYLSNIVQEDAHTLLASYCHPESWGFRWGEPGDRLRLVNRNTLEDLPGEWTLQGIAPVDSPTEDGAKTWRITTAETLPTLDDTRNWGLENVTWTPSVLFHRNLIRNNRARGALFTTRGTVRCEENCFDHVHGCAILVCGDCREWFESGACGTVNIARNDFLDNLTADYEFCHAVISVAPHLAADGERPQSPVHGVIEVTGNRFVTANAPLFYARSAQRVVFKDNGVVPSNAYPPWSPAPPPVTLRDVPEATIIPRQVY